MKGGGGFGLVREAVVKESPRRCWQSFVRQQSGCVVICKVNAFDHDYQRRTSCDKILPGRRSRVPTSPPLRPLLSSGSFVRTRAIYGQFLRSSRRTMDAISRLPQRCLLACWQTNAWLITSDVQRIAFGPPVYWTQKISLKTIFKRLTLR